MSLQFSSAGNPDITDHNLHEFQDMQQFDEHFQNDSSQDVPLSDTFLDGFDVDDCQARLPGGLPSPNASNSDLPDSCRQSPIWPLLSEFSGEYVSQPSDESPGADNDPMISHLQQRSQKSCTNTVSNSSSSRFNTDQSFSDASNNSELLVQHMDPSIIGLSSTNAGQHLNFAAPFEGSLCISKKSFQNRPATAPSTGSFERTAPIERPKSTHMSIAPKVNNTSSASVPAHQQHSPTSKFHSHLRYQIHPQPQQYSQPALTGTGDYSIDQEPQIMSSTHNFTDRQEANASPLHNDLQTMQPSANRPPFRRIASAHSQTRRSPALQSHQPFQESSLRTSVTPNWGINPWEAGQLQTQLYPDPQPMFQQQFDGSPYMGHHHISGLQGKSLVDHSPEQYCVQPSNSRDASFMAQELIDFGFTGSSPMSVKCEMSPPDSEHIASTRILKSQMDSPKPQRKRRVKQEPKNNDDNEVAIDPVALQTADLTNLVPADHANVKELIEAMHNSDNVEDNLGMQKTWEKVRKAKAMRIREVCLELLGLTKLAQQQKGVPLGAKKPFNQYATFEERFDALCATLKFQKTVCKHLIEPPYSYSVVDDPQSAKDRVKNNRKVNQQKAEAIRLGREHLGEKGQGKGKPMLKTKKRGQAQMEDGHDDEVNSADDLLSDEETDASPYSFGPKSARPKFHTSKRARGSRNRNQHQEQEGNAEASYLPQTHNFEYPFAQGPHQNVCARTQQAQMLSEHDHLANSRRSSTMNQQYGFPSGSEPGTAFYGDNSTGGSDSEGLSSTGHGYS